MLEGQEGWQGREVPWTPCALDGLWVTSINKQIICVCVCVCVVSVNVLGTCMHVCNEHVYNSLKASMCLLCGHATGGVQYHGVTDVAS